MPLRKQKSWNKYIARERSSGRTLNEIEYDLVTNQNYDPQAVTKAVKQYQEDTYKPLPKPLAVIVPTLVVALLLYHIDPTILGLVTLDTKPTIILNSPSDTETWGISNTVSFHYHVFAQQALASCSLIINDIEVQKNKFIKQGANTFTHSLSNHNYRWKISCVDSQGNEATSPELSLTVDHSIPTQIPNNTVPQHREQPVSVQSGEAVAVNVGTSPETNVFDTSTIVISREVLIGILLMVAGLVIVQSFTLWNRSPVNRRRHY